MLVGLLAPNWAESDQHEIFLQVPFLFSQRVKSRVFDRDRGLQRQALRTLHSSVVKARIRSRSASTAAPMDWPSATNGSASSERTPNVRA